MITTGPLGMCDATTSRASARGPRSARRRARTPYPGIRTSAEGPPKLASAGRHASSLSPRPGSARSATGSWITCRIRLGDLARNVAGVVAVGAALPDGAVLLLDDVLDSKLSSEV